MSFIFIDLQATPAQHHQDVTHYGKSQSAANVSGFVEDQGRTVAHLPFRSSQRV
jgi:hypothetical protein